MAAGFGEEIDLADNPEELTDTNRLLRHAQLFRSRQYASLAGWRWLRRRLLGPVVVRQVRA